MYVYLQEATDCLKQLFLSCFQAARYLAVTATLLEIVIRDQIANVHNIS